MALPDYLKVTIDHVGGNSCGNVYHRCQKVAGSDPAWYQSIPGQGVMIFCEVTPLPTGGGSSWKLLTMYMGGGACDGIKNFLLSPASSDPAGTYCLIAGGSPDCDAGQATVVED